MKIGWKDGLARAGKLLREAGVLNDSAPEGRLEGDALTKFNELVAEATRLKRDASEERAREDRLNALEAARSGDDYDGFRGGNGGYATDESLPHNDPSNTRNGYHGYSVLKTLRESIKGDQVRLTGLEEETHQELVKRRARAGLAPLKGVAIPYDLPIDLRSALQYVGDPARRSYEGGRRSSADFLRQYAREVRALDTSSGAGSLVNTLATDMITILRARMVSVAMGAVVLTDMNGEFAIPRQNAAATGYWLAEGAPPAAPSTQTIDQVAFKPRTVGSYTDYTRRFLSQTSVSAEMFVRADLMAVLARSVESAGLNGPGTDNAPRGVGQYPGVKVVTLGAAGGPMTWESVVLMETAVATENADVGSLGYILNAATRGHLKTTPKVPNFPQFLWDMDRSADMPVNGYPVGVTNLLPSDLAKSTSGNVLSMGLFGNWTDLIYAFWGALDTLVDPYTASTSGSVRVVALQDADVNLRHPESFSKCIDIKAPVAA